MCPSPHHPDPVPDARQCVLDRPKRTLLPGGLLDLGGHAVSDEPVAGLELLHGLGGVVDEGKAGALATTEVCLEAEDGDIVLLGLVELTELATELVLGDVGAVGVEDIATQQCQSLSFAIACPVHAALTRPSGDVRGEGCG
jgi:hypothetical protein